MQHLYSVWLLQSLDGKIHSRDPFVVPTVRGSQRILHSKVREKLRGSGKVGEFKSTRVHKLTKMQKEILNCCTQTAYNSSEFFLLALFADYLYLHF